MPYFKFKIENPDGIARYNFENGEYNILSSRSIQKIQLCRHAQIKILFVYLSFDKDAPGAAFDPDIFPGSLIHILMKGSRPAKSSRGKSNDFAASWSPVISEYADNLAIPVERIVVMAAHGAWSMALECARNLRCSALCLVDAREPGRMAARVGKLFGRHRADEEEIRRLLNDPFLTCGTNNVIFRKIAAKESQSQAINLPQDVAGNIKFTYCEKDAWRKSPSAILEAAIGDILDLAGIDSISPVHERMPIKSIYLVRSSVINVDKKHVIFHPSGRADLAPVLVEPPYDWNNNPFGDTNWLAQLHMWRLMDDYILMYEIKNDPAWLEPPVALILDWSSYYSKNRCHDVVWRDMNVGLRAMKLAYFLALNKSGAISLDEGALKVLGELIISHAEFLLKGEEKFSNHAMIDLHGARALAHVAPPRIANRLIKYVEHRYPPLMDKQFSANGVHLEHSPLYQKFMLGYLNILCCGGWFDAAGLGLLTQKVKNVLSWLHLPDGRLAPLGDTDGQPMPSKINSSVASTLPQMFNDSGYAIIRAGVSYLFFMGAFNSQTHKHSDDLSVIWYENQDILCDTGKYAYEKASLERAYAISTRAHNTIEVDDIDTFTPGKNEGNPAYGNQIRGIESRDGIFQLWGEITMPRFHAIHKRNIFYQPARFLIIRDYIVSEIEHKYTAHWHFSPHITITPEDSGLVAELLNGRQLFINMLSDSIYCYELIIGRREPVLQGFISTGYRQMSSNLCLACSCKAKTATITTIFALDSAMEVKNIDYNSIAAVYGDNAYEFFPYN